MSIIRYKRVAEPPRWLEPALIGSGFSSLESLGSHGWRFGFGDHCILTTSSLWRLVGPAGIIVTGEDEGQQFGLSSPVAVCERVPDALPLSSRITAVTVALVTADLRLDFGPLTSLEIISTSSGYEAWTLSAKLAAETLHLVGLGGGGLSAPVDQRD